MRKYYLPIPLFVLLLHTIAFGQKPMGMLPIPPSLANEQKVTIQNSKYYTLGYEPMVGDPVIESGGWDGFEDKIRIWIKMNMSFGRPTKFTIYKDGTALKTISGTPDPEVRLNGFSIRVPVSYKGTMLKNLEFHFGYARLGQMKAQTDVFIPKSLLKNYDKVGTATKIAGGGAEDIKSVFDGLSFGALTVTHFDYFSFAEEAQTEVKQLIAAEIDARKKAKEAEDKIAAEKKKAEDEERKKKLAADEAAKKKAADEAAAKKQAASGTAASGSGGSKELTISSGSSGGSGGTSSGGTASGSRSGGTAGGSSASPEFGKGPDGNYYRKGADGKYKQISTEEYQSLKAQRAGASGGSSAAASAITKQQQDAQLVASTQQKLQAMTDDFYAKQAETQRKAEQFSANLMQSYYAAEAVRNGKANLREASSLTGNYSTVEELEAEFNQKYSSISSEVENLNQARNQQLQSTYNSFYSNADASTKAIGQAATQLGSYLNNMRAEKEERQAKEALRRQMEEQRARIEARKREALIALRKGFFNEFPDGGVPLSGHKVVVNELYFFSYVFDKSNINAGPATVKVSNVFPIARYGDSTWPFKTSVVADVKKAAAGEGPVTLVGYYTTKEMADNMRSSFLRLANKSQIGIREMAYKGKKSSGGAATDFWGNGTKGTAKGAGDGATDAAPVKKKTDDDFWGTGGTKKAAADSTKKAVKKDDFWNN